MRAFLSLLAFQDTITRVWLLLLLLIPLSLGTALVRRGFITKVTSVSSLICSAIGSPTRLQMKEKSGHYNEPRDL